MANVIIQLNATTFLASAITTVAGLGTAANTGTLAYVTDCGTTVFNATAVGGGSDGFFVMANGVSWRIS